MSTPRNFLLGKGERLTSDIVPSGRKMDKVAPYTFDEARTRLVPMLSAVASAIDALPAAACPNGEAVSSLILNPEYIAKSYYPNNLLRNYGLRAVGSRESRVTPEKRSKGRTPEEKITTELFIAGSKNSFKRLAQEISAVTADSPVAKDMPVVEQMKLPSAKSKVKKISSTTKQIPLEVVVHASEFSNDAYILKGFEDYIKGLGLEVDLKSRLHAGGLCFLKMMAPKDRIDDIAKFSFLRTVREMPRLRIQPATRGVQATTEEIMLPKGGAVDSNIRVAVFDGGVPAQSPLSPWVTSHEPHGIGKAVPAYIDHGYAVTSALLFGHLKPGTMASQPYVQVDHYRVLDEDSEQDPLELFDVLERIKGVLETSPKYDFINLSIGPSLPVDDDDVHAWTSVLDEYLADGNTLATLAVGNTGESDTATGLHRIQVPSDCVNALSIGACDTFTNTWKRASYSSIGPGRSPGIVKPDLVAFGGSQNTPYHVLRPAMGFAPAQEQGTSFASPHALRMGTAVKAHFGTALNPLAIRSLLIHATQGNGEPQHEVGWGRISDDLDDIVICQPGVVRVVFQGEISASKYIRAEIPLPNTALTGNVKISATCCFATEIDAAHPSNYTRSGIEITFRPNEDVRDENALHPKTDTFFSQSKIYQTEDELRADAHKWETCLHATKTKRASSLKAPVFDIHYLARDEGRAVDNNQVRKLYYALVVTVEAPKHKDLYDQIVRKYRARLEPMTPVIQVPIRR